ncbi:RDD family protein [Saccharicrinis sp. FJH2]|uniref:RDD family protein n=1 Tax=Saccharicrinis sp. FJH65 TaxID=3344659 RepID=UPI0035F370BD
MKIPKILIFNIFTRQSFNGGFKTLQIFGRRLNSMSMDFSFMLGLIFPFFIILFIPVSILVDSGNETNFLLPLWIEITPFTFISFLILNKDFFNGKSIAKRQYGYQVIDSKTNRPASEFQCIIRNSTMIIWPLEVIFSMVNPTKRLGDFIAGTKLANSEKEDPELIMNEIYEKRNIENKSRLIFTSIVIALTFSILSALPTIITLR